MSLGRDDSVRTLMHKIIHIGFAIQIEMGRKGHVRRFLTCDAPQNLKENKKNVCFL